MLSSLRTHRYGAPLAGLLIAMLAIPAAGSGLLGLRVCLNDQGEVTVTPLRTADAAQRKCPRRAAQEHLTAAPAPADVAPSVPARTALVQEAGAGSDCYFVQCAPTDGLQVAAVAVEHAPVQKLQLASLPGQAPLIPDSPRARSVRAGPPLHSSASSLPALRTVVLLI